MIAHAGIEDPSLLGIGIYTAGEAARLTGLPAARIRRWLQSHEARGQTYPPCGRRRSISAMAASISASAT